MSNAFINQSQGIEQLWYTSSKYGLGTMAVGHRIRAASPGLSDLTTPLVQMLEPYLQYALPDGVDGLNTIPEQAALSLSLGDLTSSGYGRILVNKRFTGRDAGGRPSLFFSHLLYSHTTTAFHAKDAILLWRTPFWRLSDEGQGNRVGLPRLTQQEAQQEYADYISGPLQGRYEGKYERATFKRIAPPQRKKPDFSKIHACLRFVIQAYLISQQGYQHIYLAAPPDVVADVIFGLTRCLPRPLLTKLTFSTYERSVEDKNFLLVGTCWDQQTRSTLDLPPACYNDHLAYNVFSGTHSPLKEDPLQHFANYAVSCLISDNFGELDRLIDKTESLPDLNVRTFLQYYRQIIIEAQAPTKEGVGGCFDTPGTAADFLSRLVVQQFIMTEAMKDAEWRTKTLKPGLQLLFSERAKYQGLTEALAGFATMLSSTTLVNVDTWYSEGSIHSSYARGVIILLEMMFWITDNKSDAWQQQPELLLQPQKEQIFIMFVKAYQNAYFELLDYWAKLDPPVAVQRITSLLDLNLAQDRLARFYAAPLPAHWKHYVTEQVIQSSNSVLQIIPQKTDIEGMIATYAEIDWYKAEELSLILVQRGYPHIFDLLVILLDARAIPPGGYTRLISRISLNVIDQVYILKRYGPKFLPTPQDEEAMLNQLSFFSGSNQAEFAQKQDILKSWLKSPYPQLTYWFTQPGNLDKVLKHINLATSSESNWFLDEFGSTPPTSQIPSSMVEDYVRQYLENFEPRKIGKNSFYDYLEQNPGILRTLPPDIQQGVENQKSLSHFLKHPSFLAQDLKPFNMAIHSKTYSRAIGEREKLAAQLVESLANALALRVETDTHLSALAHLLDSAFTPFTFQIFYRMAEIVRDGIAQQDTKMLCKALLMPYIRFALSSDSVFADRDYKHFYYTFLDLLLQSTSESVIQQLDIDTGGTTLRKWNEYKTARQALVPVDQARPGIVQPPPANQSQGGDMNQMVATGGKSASAAPDSQPRHDRQPYQNPATQSAQHQGQQESINWSESMHRSQQKPKIGPIKRFFRRLFPPPGTVNHLSKK